MAWGNSKCFRKISKSCKNYMKILRKISKASNNINNIKFLEKFRVNYLRNLRENLKRLGRN